MQRIVKGGMWVGDIVFGEKAIVGYPCSSEYEERGTGNQPPPTDRVLHRLRETDGEEHDQKTRDHQIAVQKPGVLPHSEIADHLIEGRVALAQEAIKGDHQQREDGTDYPSHDEESCQAVPNPSRAVGIYSRLYHLCESFQCSLHCFRASHTVVFISFWQSLTKSYPACKVRLRWDQDLVPGNSLVEKGREPPHLSATAVRQNWLRGLTEFSPDTAPGKVHERGATECVGQKTAEERPDTTGNTKSYPLPHAPAQAIFLSY